MVVKFRVRQKVAAWLVDEVEVYADSEEEAMGMLKENINRNTGEIGANTMDMEITESYTDWDEMETFKEEDSIKIEKI